MTSFGGGGQGLLEVVTDREITSFMVEPPGRTARCLTLH